MLDKGILIGHRPTQTHTNILAGRLCPAKNCQSLRDTVLKICRDSKKVNRAFNISNFFISLGVLSILLVLPLFSFAGEFKVIHIYDGDTVKAAENGNEIITRLVGIDAPEMSYKEHLPGMPFCTKSKEHLASLVLNKAVDIKFYGRDTAGRTLGEIIAGKVNINIEMLQAGLAEVYRGAPAKNLNMTPYRDAERSAKLSVKGIWELRDQYFSPRDWREMHNK